MFVDFRFFLGELEVEAFTSSNGYGREVSDDKMSHRQDADGSKSAIDILGAPPITVRWDWIS